MRRDRQGSCVAVVLAAIIVGCLLLILYGFASSYKECKDKGGEYVRSFDGYACIGEDK